MVVDEAGVPREAPASNPYWRPLRKFNSYQNRIQFILHWVVQRLLFGNFYSIKSRDLRGIVQALYPMDARKTRPLVTSTGEVYYDFAGDDLSGLPEGARAVPAREVIHDRGVTLWHPLMGVSPLTACAASASQGLRIQENSSQFFENMSRPSGMLSSPGTISDTTATRLKREWETNYSAANIGRMAVLGDGLKYEAMTIPAHDAQLIQQLAWTVEDVARCYAVPLYKINAGAIPTAGNVEALESQYYTGCLQIIIESMELTLTEGLELPPGYTVDFDLDGLLRMDTATHIDALTNAVGGGLMSPDEARRKINLPSVPGGSSVYLQQQNYSLEALARRDARPDPFSTVPASAPARVSEEPDTEDTDDSDDLEELRLTHQLVKAFEEANCV
jgi:HK97 family phage portal protein